MRMNKKVIAIAVSSLLMVGCANTHTKQDTGAGLGALLGGGLAYGLGQYSSNKEIWTVLGIALGAIIGSNIGQQLDERDKMLAGMAMQRSLEYAPDNQMNTWKNPNTGNSGTVVPMSTVVNNNGTPCREFTTTIFVGGKQEQGYGTACRQSDGNWKIVQ